MDKKSVWEEYIRIAKERSSGKTEEEITVAEFIEQTGMTIDQARCFLRKLEREGKIEKRMIINPSGAGGLVAVYRLKK